MDKILIITIGSNGEQILTVAKVDNLINGWYQNEEMPANGDTVLCCVFVEPDYPIKWRFGSKYYLRGEQL